MKSGKLLATVLAAALTASSMLFCASAADKYSPEVGDGYISFDFNVVNGGMVNHVHTAEFEKDVEKDGVKAVKFVPTPDLADSTAYTIDCYSLGNYDAKIEVPKYRYVGVTYYYDSKNPTYDGKMTFNILPGSTKATGSLSATSSAPIETGKWTEAYFSFNTTMELKETDKPWINQCHFRPFGSTAPTDLTKDDVLYVAKYTFYENNPDSNAVSSAEFVKGNPDAVGNSVKLTFKAGEEYTVPQNPFTFASAAFLGWRNSYDQKLYQGGDVVKAIDGDVVYTAEWKVEANTEEFISLPFPDYENGIVNHVTTGFLEDVEMDGRTVVMCSANKEYEDQTKLLSVDGYSYKGANIDLEAYKWFAVEYKYESPNPIDTNMLISIMVNGNVLTKAPTALSTEKLVTGTWTIALFDFTGNDALLNPDTNDHIMRQMHLRPFGNTKLESISANDIMYISRVMFFREKPDFVTHDAYMKGYDDGTFKPNGNMSRAEACTVIARLLEAEENIAGTSSFTDVAADAWYAKYIGFCQNKGLLPSYSGEFFPDKDITRAEFAELVYLTGLAKAGEASVTFTDVDAAHPKYASIAAAASAQLIRGYPDGTFKPDATITRAEVVTVVNRARDRSRTAEQVTSDYTMIFMDVDDSFWGFYDIAEASVPHVEWDGKWLYPTRDPIKALLEKVDIGTLINTEAGNAKVAELDALEAQRIAEIRAAESNLSKVTGKKIYVSASGADTNDGLTENTPVKSVSKANGLVSKGDAILLKRGDLFREKFTAKSGVTYSAYGTGAKPVVYGSPENGADPEKWTLDYENAETGAKIWKYSNEKMVDVGTLVLNEGEGYTMKEIPTSKGANFLVRGTTDVPFDYKKELDKDMEFFHCANSKTNGSIIDAGTAVGPLYFRCDEGNPGKVFDSIEFNTKGNIIGIGGADVTIDNLCIKYGGSHGIGSGTVSGLTVTNCEIGWIGGSIQSYNANATTDGRATRFGNGVEIYGGCDRYTIDNCYVYQCYDAGVTHQLSGHTSGNCSMTNITYSNNVITECVYSIEYFLGASSDGGTYKREGSNVLFDSNILRRAGYGFGSFRPDGHNQRHIRSGSSDNIFENYVIKNNIFDRSVYELFQVNSKYTSTLGQMQGNTYIQGYDNRLCSYGTGNGKTVTNDFTAMAAVRNTLKDENGALFYVEEIPYYEYSYKPAKVVPVDDNDRKAKASTGAESAVVAETTGTAPAVKEEVKEPYFVKYAKDEKLWADKRAAMVVEYTDKGESFKYAHITTAKESTAFLMDCYNLNPSIPLADGQFVVKLLIRTNYAAKPSVSCYNITDEAGEKLSGSASGTASAALKADETWEQYTVKIDKLPDGAFKSTQIHNFYWGNSIKGDTIDDGKYADIAAWGVFPNQASADAFDLLEAVKNY